MVDKTASHHSTAIHEAGHAVIGRVLGLSCGHATIEPDGDSAGHCIIETPWITLDKWWGDRPGVIGLRLHGTLESAVRAHILSLMAGWAAEVEMLGECRGGDSGDRDEITLMLNDLAIPGWRQDGDGSWERYENRLRDRTRWLVRHHRDKIQKVATALIENRTLTAEQIDAILADE